MSVSIHNNTVLDNSSLQKLSPSIFAESAHHAMSRRYGFIPTIRVIDGLRSAGWHPIAAREQMVRLDDRRGFTKHVVRLRQSGLAFGKVGDVLPELVLLNSHDGSSAYQMHAGLFRLVCSNGLVVSDSTFSKISVRHSGNVVERVLEGAATVVHELPRIAQNVESMKATVLNRQAQEAFARAALVVKYVTPEAAPIDAARLLNVRRSADQGSDIWSTLNRVQENLIRGGLCGRTAEGKRTRTRAVNSINEDTRINKALWQLAEEINRMLAIHGYLKATS